MRTTGLPSMLDTLARNYNNRNPEAWLYEISSEYLPREGEDLPEEKAVLMVGCYGGEADFFTQGHCGIPPQPAESAPRRLHRRFHPSQLSPRPLCRPHRWGCRDRLGR